MFWRLSPSDYPSSRIRSVFFEMALCTQFRRLVLADDLESDAPDRAAVQHLEDDPVEPAFIRIVALVTNMPALGESGVAVRDVLDFDACPGQSARDQIGILGLRWQVRATGLACHGVVFFSSQSPASEEVLYVDPCVFYENLIEELPGRGALRTGEMQEGV